MKLLIEIPEEKYNYFILYRNSYKRSIAESIINGRRLPDDCEILTKEAYADLCMRASKGQEPNCSTTNPFFTVSGVNELAKYSIETIGHSDPYLQGMCNGIEYMRGVLTDTEPHFFTEVEREDKG